MRFTLPWNCWCVYLFCVAFLVSACVLVPQLVSLWFWRERTHVHPLRDNNHHLHLHTAGSIATAKHTSLTYYETEIKQMLKLCCIFAYIFTLGERERESETGREHVRASTVWERFNRSLGVWCESLSRVHYHLGCSGDDKAQVQGPVIVGFFFLCVCV